MKDPVIRTASPYIYPSVKSPRSQIQAAGPDLRKSELTSLCFLVCVFQGNSTPPAILPPFLDEKRMALSITIPPSKTKSTNIAVLQ